MKAVFNIPHPDGGRSELRDTERPSPKTGEILVKVAASAVNRGELTGLRAARKGEATIGGLEFSGEVVDTGAGATHFRVGDRVMGQYRACQAEFIAIDERLAMPVPDSLDLIEAAAFPNCYVTAHDALVTNAALRSGETVLVNAASSGIGMATIQIATALGARLVIGTTRSPGKLALIKEQGANVGIDTSSQGFVEAVLQATDKKGVDIIIDCVGGAVLADNLQALTLLGRLVSVGRLGPKNGDIDLDLLALKRLKLIGVTFRTRTLEDRVECIRRCWEDLAPFVASGKIRPHVDKVFPVEQIDAAQRHMESATHVGKIVMKF